MSVEYLELADRVLRCEVAPDMPGTCRRTLTIRVVSGPDLTGEEYGRASAAVVAELVARGVDVVRWGCPDEPRGS